MINPSKIETKVTWDMSALDNKARELLKKTYEDLDDGSHVEITDKKIIITKITEILKIMFIRTIHTFAVGIWGESCSGRAQLRDFKPTNPGPMYSPWSFWETEAVL